MVNSRSCRSPQGWTIHASTLFLCVHVVVHFIFNFFNNVKSETTNANTRGTIHKSNITWLRETLNVCSVCSPCPLWLADRRSWWITINQLWAETPRLPGPHTPPPAPLDLKVIPGHRHIVHSCSSMWRSNNSPPELLPLTELLTLFLRDLLSHPAELL